MPLHAMPASAQLCWTVLSGSCHCRRRALTTIYKHGEGEVGISETVAAPAGALGLSKLSARCH